jgi:hypothetical protein
MEWCVKLAFLMERILLSGQLNTCTHKISRTKLTTAELANSRDYVNLAPAPVPGPAPTDAKSAVLNSALFGGLQFAKRMVAVTSSAAALAHDQWWKQNLLDKFIVKLTHDTGVEETIVNSLFEALAGTISTPAQRAIHPTIVQPNVRPFVNMFVMPGLLHALAFASPPVTRLALEHLYAMLVMTAGNTYILSIQTNWMKWFCPLLAEPQVPAIAPSEVMATRRISHFGKEKYDVVHLVVNIISVVLYFQFSVSREDMTNMYATGIYKGKLPRT